MPLNLSKPTAGDIGWTAAINQNWTDIENQSNDQVTGPASASDNAVVRFDGTTGKLVQNGAVTIDDTLGQVSWPTGGGAGTRVLGPSDQDLAIAADSAGASSAGRALSLAGGPGGATSGAGGDASLVGGAPADGNGGAVAITGAAGVGTNRNGGAVSITGGAATGSGTPGDVSFSARGGSATFNQSGQASLAAAYGSAGATSIIGALNAIAAGQVGGGTVTGPGSSTDNAVVRWDGTAGTVIQNSAVTISDTLGRINWPTGGGAGTRILGPSDQDLAIAAESAGASSAGRAVSVTGGPGGGTSGAGGAASLQGGAAAGGNSAGGSASAVGGAGVGTSAGGAASLTGGVGGATGTGGAVTIASGAGGGTSGASGAVTIQSGTTTDGNSGAITLESRDATGTNRTGGALTIATGAGTGTGKAGLIIEKVGGFIRRITSTPVTLSDGVATTILTISLSAGQRVNGLITVFMDVTNGTDFQSLTRVFGFSAADKAGTLSHNVDPPDGFFPGVATGGSVDAGPTLSILDGSNEISLQLLVGTTLSSATLSCCFVLDTKHSSSGATYTVA